MRLMIEMPVEILPCLYVTDTLNIKVVSQYDMYYVNNNRVMVKCGGCTLCSG